MRNFVQDLILAESRIARGSSRPLTSRMSDANKEASYLRGSSVMGSPRMSIIALMENNGTSSDSSIEEEIT